MSKFDTILKRIQEQTPTGSILQKQNNNQQVVSNQNQTNNFNSVKTSTGQNPTTQNTNFSITNPETAKVMQALANTKTMAEVTQALSDPNIQKVLQGFLSNYKS